MNRLGAPRDGSSKTSFDLEHALRRLRRAVGSATLFVLASGVRAQGPAELPASEEGDLRNQTFVIPLGFERGQALSVLRAALVEGALREALDAAALLVTGPSEELVSFDERLHLSPREALPHLCAGAEPALREAWSRRFAAPRWPADAPPLTDAALLDLERRAPLSPLAVAALRRAGDERWLAGDALAAAALYRRARLHAGGESEAIDSLAVRASACAALLESPSATREVAARHRLDAENAGPSGFAFETWAALARGALGLEVEAPADAPGAPPRFELAWCEPLDPDGQRRRLSADRGIRARGPKALETDFRPAFAHDQVLVQDRRYLYRFAAEGGLRLERVDLGEQITALGVPPEPDEEPLSLAVLRRRPAAFARSAIAVHDERRGVLLALELAESPGEPAAPRWAIATGTLHRLGEPPRVVAESGTAPPVFQPFPLVVDRRVYAVARRTQGGKERVELWCCDRASGEPLWIRALCEGAPVRTQNSRSFRPSGGTLPTSAPVYSDGLVFVATGLGVLAACDALDGSVAWLLLTARSSEAGPRWSTAEPILTRQGLFCAPQDADFLYALRRELPTGATRASALFLCPPIARGSLEAHLVAEGERHYFYVRTPHWREVAELALAPLAAAPDAPLEARWRTSGDTGSHEEDLLYLPAVSGGELVLCTDRYLYAFDCARGFLATFRARAPVSPATAAPLPTRRVFGNVAAFRAGIVVVGAEGVSFWIRRP